EIVSRISSLGGRPSCRHVLAGSLELEEPAAPPGTEVPGAVRESLAVRVHVLAQQRDLAITGARELLDLLQDLRHGARDLLAPGRRHDAVRAALVAAFHDGHEGGDAGTPVVAGRSSLERADGPVHGEDAARRGGERLAGGGADPGGPLAGLG